MSQFWALALLLGLVAAAFVAVPAYLRASRSRIETAGEQRVSANVAIYEERLAELSVLRDTGEITQDEFQQLETELQKTLLGDTANLVAEAEPDRAVGWLPFGVAAAIPLFAIVAYAGFGLAWGSIDDVSLARSLGQANEETINESLGELAERLKTQPDNDEGWFFLGRSLLNTGDYEGAASAFNHLLGRYPRDPDLSGYHAESLFLADKRTVTERVEAAVSRTLALNPHNITMLEIRAMDAFGRGDSGAAVDWFKSALAAGATGERARLIEHAIATITSANGDDAADAPNAAEPAGDTVAQAAPTPASRALDVLVEVDSVVNVPANAAVFIFARAVAGPPMPLAVARMTRADLPKLVRLDESMAMTPGMGLANFDRVVVVARISATGAANASPDDFEAISDPVDLTEATGVIKLRLKERIRAKPG